MAFLRWYFRALECWPPDAQEHMKWPFVYMCVSVRHPALLFSALCVFLSPGVSLSICLNSDSSPLLPTAKRAEHLWRGANTHIHTHLHIDTSQVLMHSSTSELPPSFFTLSPYLPTSCLYLLLVCICRCLSVCCGAPLCSKWLVPAGWVIFQWHWCFHPCSLLGCGVYELTS